VPTRLSPGVQVEADESGAHPVEGVGTAVAALVGMSGSGPTNTPTLVTDWSRYTSIFGQFVGSYHLAHAVHGYFLIGGGSCHVVRVGRDGRSTPMPTGVPGVERALEATTRGNARQSGCEVPASTCVVPADFVGSPAGGTGFGGLEAIGEITMVSVPDLTWAHQHELVDLEAIRAVQLAMIAHCELMGDRVAIIDTPPNLDAEQVREWRVDAVGHDSKDARRYWPWIYVLDPAQRHHGLLPLIGAIFVRAHKFESTISILVPLPSNASAISLTPCLDAAPESADTPNETSPSALSMMRLPTLESRPCETLTRDTSSLRADHHTRLPAEAVPNW